MVLAATQIQPGQTGHAAGRQLLEQLYRQQTGQALPEIAVTSRGKPYFPDSCWHFSISHTKRHAFCVLSHRPVGIDAEERDRAIRPELAQKILSRTERERYARAQDPRLALLKLWVLKEAQAKCSGEGLRGYPDHTDFSPEDDRLMEMHGCIVAVIEEE